MVDESGLLYRNYTISCCNYIKFTHLFYIFSKLNLLKLTKHDENIKYTFDLDDKILEENEINKKIIDLLIGATDKETDEYYKTFYM